MPPVDKWRVTGSLRKYIKIFAYSHGGGGSECPVHTMMIDMGIMHNGYSWFWGFSPEWLNDYCRVIPDVRLMWTSDAWEGVETKDAPPVLVTAVVAAFNRALIV